MTCCLILEESTQVTKSSIFLKKETVIVAASDHFKAVAHASILFNDSVFAEPTV